MFASTTVLRGSGCADRDARGPQRTIHRLLGLRQSAAHGIENLFHLYKRKVAQNWIIDPVCATFSRFNYECRS